MKLFIGLGIVLGYFIIVKSLDMVYGIRLFFGLQIYIVAKKNVPKITYFYWTYYVSGKDNLNHTLQLKESSWQFSINKTIITCLNGL